MEPFVPSLHAPELIKPPQELSQDIIRDGILNGGRFTTTVPLTDREPFK